MGKMVVGRLQLILAIAGLSIPNRLLRKQELKDKAEQCDAYKSSNDLKAAMVAWDGDAAKLSANTTAIHGLLGQLNALYAAQPDLVLAFDTSGDNYLGAAKKVCGTSRTIATALDLLKRAPTRVAMVGTVQDVAIGHTLRNVPYLHWSPLDGAKSYVAQMSATPDVEASFVDVLGKGAKRSKLPVVAGVQVSFRVCGVAPDGSRSAWSALIPFKKT